MNESGFQVGIGRGQWIVVLVVEGMNHRFTHLISSIGDTEHITVIKVISAGAMCYRMYVGTMDLPFIVRVIPMYTYIAASLRS